MTERRADRSQSPRRHSRYAVGVTWAAAAFFLALLAVLAMRVAAGQDPALRGRAAAGLPARQVLVRRIYERRVIIHLPPTAPPQPTRTSQQMSSAGGSVSPLPITRTS
jgi:hypothetical protein